MNPYTIRGERIGGCIRNPPVMKLTAIAHVMLKPRVTCSAIHAWRSGRSHETTSLVVENVGPGATEFVEFILAE